MVLPKRGEWKRKEKRKMNDVYFKKVLKECGSVDLRARMMRIFRSGLTKRMGGILPLHKGKGEERECAN